MLSHSKNKKNFNDRVLECSINNPHIVHAATMQVSVGFAAVCMKHHCAEYLRQLLECNTVQGWVPAFEYTQAYFQRKEVSGSTIVEQLLPRSCNYCLFRRQQLIVGGRLGGAKGWGGKLLWGCFTPSSQ